MPAGTLKQTSQLGAIDQRLGRLGSTNTTEPLELDQPGHVERGPPGPDPRMGFGNPINDPFTLWHFDVAAGAVAALGQHKLPTESRIGSSPKRALGRTKAQDPDEVEFTSQSPLLMDPAQALLGQVQILIGSNALKVPGVSKEAGACDGPAPRPKREGPIVVARASSTSRRESQPARA